MPILNTFKYTQQLLQKKLKANEKLPYVGLQNTLRYIKHLTPKTKYTRTEYNISMNTKHI